MSETHRHFHDELSRLKVRLLTMSGEAEAAVGEAMEALLARSADRAPQVVEGDRRVDALEVEIEEQCVSLLALHQPMARDLRTLIAITKIATDLERVGDHAVNIAQSAVRLAQSRPITPEPELVEMARLARGMLADALEAFIRGDAQAGREVCQRDDKVDALNRSVFRILLTPMMDDPHQIGGLYVSYRYEPAAGIPFECLVGAPEELGPAAIVPSGATHRTYRLGVAATGEYTTFFGSTVPLALAGITTTINAVNAIYNRDVAVRLVLIANETNVIYTNPATDPFPLSNLNAEVQAALDGTIGDANYDVGHVFHASGFSGNAGCIACVCSSGSKGSGFSQDATPNDGDFVFLVAHEMGHQHGGRHSWTGTGCGTSQWEAPASR